METEPGIEEGRGATSGGLAPPSVPTARRCYLTLMFCDMSDSTQLGAALEAEEYADMLGRIRSACAAIVSRHGGVVVRTQGDGMLAMFGYPQAREDDGRRAVEAAVDFHEHVRRLQPAYLPAALAPLSMHSGIHSGLVLLDKGDIVLGRFELLGNVPNVAAGLAGFAGRDEIVVSEESLGPQAHFFLTGPRLAFQPKGGAQPLSVYRVAARASTPNRFEARALRGMAPFVGRHDELRTLEQHRQAVSEGGAQFVAVCGSPGMGKTRLIEEFLARSTASGCQVLRGYCESYLSAEPLQPFLQMLRTLFDIVHGMSGADALAAVDAGLAAIHPPLAAQRDEFARMLSLATPAGAAHRPAVGSAPGALHDLVEALARRRPVLLFVDDWQWADDASRQALNAILGIGRSVFVLLASRGFAEDDALRRRAAVIELAPLSIDETTLAVEKLLPSTNPFIAEEFHRYAGGNPLFIEELCHSAAAGGTARHLDIVHRGAAWLNALVESRVESLPPAQAELVRTAAVIGNVFPAWILERLTGHGERDPLVVDLAEQDFIFPTDRGGMLRFKHGITRDVIYDAVGLHPRRAMHLSIAAAYESGGNPDDACEALAYHYGAGGDVVNAARFAEAAGDKAMAASALDRARTQYCAALSALDEVGRSRREALRRWIGVVHKLGIVCVFDPLGVEHALDLFERGFALAGEFGEPELLARSAYWLGYACYGKGRAKEAKKHCEHALELAARMGDERLGAQLRATLGQVLASACEYDRALELLDAAVEAKRRQVQGGQRNLAVGSAFSLSCKGLILGDRGLFDQAHECFAQALELIAGAEHQVESSVRGWMCTVYQWQGRWDEGLREAAEAVRIGEQVKSSHLLTISRALWGYCSWMHSGDPRGLKVVEDATAWVEVRDGRLFSSLNHGWLVDGYVSLGQRALARRHAARAFVRGRELDRIGEALACRAMARDAGQDGDRARVERYLRWAMRCAEARGSPHERASTQLCRAEIAARLGDRDDARRALEAACAAFERMQMHWHMQRADALWRDLR